HRVLGNHESLGELAVRRDTLHKQAKHFAFTLGERLRVVAFRSGRLWPGKLTKQLARETRRQRWLTAGGCFEHGEQRVRLKILKEVALSAGLDRLEEIGIILGGCEDHDLDVRLAGADETRSIKAAHVWD